MTFDIFLFYLFSILALFSAFFTVTSKNPIHSVLFLVFFNTSGLLILLGVEFLAMLFLTVYVGAVAVLFLFLYYVWRYSFGSYNRRHFLNSSSKK